MAKSTFHGNAGTYGLFNIVLAIGSASGALLAGASAHPRRRILVLSAAAFGLFQASAAIAPDLAVFLALLGAMGFVNLVFQSMANASVQLAVDPELRGRVMGLYMLAFIGGTPIGAPVIGALTNHFGARAGMAICGVVPLLAAVVVAVAGRRRAERDGRAPHADPARPRPWSAGNAISASRVNALDGGGADSSRPGPGGADGAAVADADAQVA
jgi:MFS family permease